ncbi:MAG: phosphoenolpyruvate synthase [Candidatus Heimdallarchaeota archaeon]|nr:phosphoenolpyruvate synthase [Candidatus Heimdallarchaeota archaeon]
MEKNYVLFEDNILTAQAGGKGLRLIELFNRGLNVPNGLVILPGAFKNDKLDDETWKQIQRDLNIFRINGVKFAVRSSALAEDSAEASFAGEFETVLNVQSDDEILDAIYEVYHSKDSERVITYSKTHNIDFSHKIAIVIQIMIQSEISGVLFTSDPVTGNREIMLGNYVHGLGEQLVSGAVNAEEFKLDKKTLSYEGPELLRKYAPRLLHLGNQLVELYNEEQDIEWAIYNNEVYLLQTRPITTLYAGGEDLWDENASKLGDYIWTNRMTLDILPYPLTPASWSIWKLFMNRQSLAGIQPYGFIGGIIYVNFTFMYSVMKKVLRNKDKCDEYIISLFNEIPQEFAVKTFGTWDFIKNLMVKEIKVEFKKSKLVKNRLEIFENIHTKHRYLLKNISQYGVDDIEPLYRELIEQYWNILTIMDYMNERFMGKVNKLRGELTKEVGEEQRDVIISHMSGVSSQLESIAPIVGVHKLINNEITEEEFINTYGHRSAYENYLSYPRPYEDPKWVAEQIKQYQLAEIDINVSLKKSTGTFDAIWNEVMASVDGKKSRKLRKQISEILEITEMRENTRSSLTRLLASFRIMLLQAGKLLELGDEIFFLNIDEILTSLKGKDIPQQKIEIRKQNFKKVKALPALPEWIGSGFDPYTWANDPNRNYDLVPMRGAKINLDADIVGYPGSAGIVEGVVRLVHTPEEAMDIQKGEILVTSTTNVGWTPIFPKLAGVITDSGATLSHAAIVARELGIPAVVGSKNATHLLKTGNRVRIDGTKGTVMILS